MGFFGGLANEGYDRQYDDRELLKRMAAYFRPYGRMLGLVFVLVLLISISGAILPVIVSKGLDALKAGLQVQNIAVLTGSVAGITLLSWFANWSRRRLVVRIVGNTVLDLRTEAFRATSDHDLSFYDEFASGKIVSRITSDTQEFGQTVVLVTDLFSQVIQAGLLAFILFSYEWRLTLVLFAVLPFVFLAAISFRHMARNVTRTGMRAMANVNATIKETISGISVAKNFRQEASVYADFDAANKTSFKVNVRRVLVFATIFPTLNALSGIGTALLVYAGGFSAAQGTVSLGAWYLFIQSLDRFFFPVQSLSAFWTQVQSGLSAAERVFALIDAEAAVVQVDNQPVGSMKGEIWFDNLCFHYSTKETVLENFNLKIRAGENIALVGHTGAGKSSIAKLIARFYEFQEGKLLIDGRDIRTFNLHEYRQHLGIVSQIPFLFSGTVLENICYACSTNVNQDEVEKLAAQIGNGEWLETLPDGLNTEVGERGARLSMGQRQLVALMRVLVQKPSIFILDEATASIDPFTEWQIQQALKLILANTTSILIAHRLSTVKAVDRIIVLQQGKIIEEGNHTGLLAQGGHYADLYNTYFRHQSLDYKPVGMEEFLKGKKILQARAF